MIYLWIALVAIAGVALGAACTALLLGRRYDADLALADDAYDVQEARADQAEAELARLAGELAELHKVALSLSAALGGPYSPDIDVVEPFGDPGDDDAPDDDLAPSEAEMDWAAERLIRDPEDPRYHMPENQHATAILRRGGYRAEVPELATPAGR